MGQPGTARRVGIVGPVSADPHGPTRGQGHPPQQYPVPPPYGYASGQYSHQPQQWTQNQSLYGNQYSNATPPANRSGALGIVGFVVVFVATITLIIVSWIGGQGFGQFILDTEASGLSTEEDLANSPVTMEYVRSATGIVLGATLACLGRTHRVGHQHRCDRSTSWAWIRHRRHHPRGPVARVRHRRLCHFDHAGT